MHQREEPMQYLLTYLVDAVDTEFGWTAGRPTGANRAYRSEPQR